MRRLLIRPGAMGDVIVSLPALESLRAEFTEVWTTGENSPLIRCSEAVRAVADTGLDLLGIPGIIPPDSLIQRLRSFDEVISWYGSHRPEVRAAFEELGIPVRFLPALPKASDGHATDFYLAQAKSLGGRPALAVPRIATPWQPHPYVMIHPFSGARSKNWLLERFREVARRIDFPVQWVAGPEEELEGAERFSDRYELACRLAGARLFLGNDSGVSHLAAAVGTPTVAIFGPTNPDIWQPRGPSVTVIRAHSAELDDVPVDEVVATVRRLLD